MTLGYFTCRNKTEAKDVAYHLLQNKLIACANVIGEIESYYVWNQAIQEDAETLLLVKTMENKKSELIKAVMEKHSYDEPCIVFYEASGASPEYEKWVKESVQ